jgi:hypothetical protein
MGLTIVPEGEDFFLIGDWPETVVFHVNDIGKSPVHCRPKNLALIDIQVKNGRGVYQLDKYVAKARVACRLVYSELDERIEKNAARSRSFSLESRS